MLTKKEIEGGLEGGSGGKGSFLPLGEEERKTLIRALNTLGKLTLGKLTPEEEEILDLIRGELFLEEEGEENLLREKLSNF